MRTGHRLSRIILFICLLTLQLQVLAASTLSCLHADADTSSRTLARAADHCPHLHQVVAAPADETAESAAPAFADCQKCVLDLCVSGALGVLSQPQLTAEPIRSTHISGREPHFYRFSIDLWSKPPISPRG